MLLRTALLPGARRGAVRDAAAGRVGAARGERAVRGGGQLTMTRAYRELTVARGSLLQMLVPLGIAAGGALFFGEHFQPHELVGAALILGGTLLTMLRR